MGQGRNQNQTDDQKLILQKLDQVCQRLDRNERTMSTGFKSNTEEHKELFRKVHDIEMQSTEDRSHTHPHCESCLTHTSDIKTINKDLEAVDKRIDKRDGIGIALILTYLATAIKAWWPR